MQDPVASLRAALARTVVESKWFEGKIIPLDGYDFVNCRFDRCSLTHHGSDWKLEGCAIVDSTIALVPVPAETAALLAQVDAHVQKGDLAGACRLVLDAAERNERP